MPMLIEMVGFTLLVVADGLGLAQDLNLAFRRYQSVTVLGPVFDAASARDTLRSGAIDVVVVDLERADGMGLQLMEALHQIAPTPIVASSCENDPQVAATVLAAGGAGILPRDLEARRALEMLHIAAEGGIALPDDHLSSVVEYLHATQTERQRAGVAALTGRELEVLTHLAEGRSVAEIATALGISGSTVQAHVKGVFAKLEVHSQVEAVRVAWRTGLARVPASA
jgi:two-component system nitrate/nitrite response regulator NarL